MHLCFAESMQNSLTKLPGMGTPKKAAAWLSKPGPLEALKRARARELSKTGLEPHPAAVVAAFVASPAAKKLLP